MALTLHGTVSDNTVALDRKTVTPLIINGDMRIFQRGTTTTGVTASGYQSADRFTMDMADQGTFTLSQSTDVPTGQGFFNSFKLDCTTADTSLGASNRVAFRQKIEDQNFLPVKKGTSSAETLTVSFWVKSNKTGTYVLELYDLQNSRHCNKSYTIDSANTWEKKIINYPADTTGAMAGDNGSGVMVHFWITAGSTYTGGASLQTAWAGNNTDKRAVGLTVNIADSTDNEWYMTGLQMEIGTYDANSIPAFQFEDVSTSLARCQRYFYNPLQGTSDAYGAFGQVVCLSSTTARGILFSPNVMRTLPTIVTSGDLELAGDSFTIEVSSIATSGRTGTQAMEFTYTVSSGLPSGEGAIVRRRNDADATFQLDAEL